MNDKNKLRTWFQRFCAFGGFSVVVAVPVMSSVFYAFHRWLGLEWDYAVILGFLVSFFLVPVSLVCVMFFLAQIERAMTRLFTRHSASERLVAFLKKDCGFLKRDIDVDHFLTRIEQVGALTAIREFLQHADADNLHLPPGYWKFIQHLKQELEEQE
jgi:uncharacterized membrane protein